jgi:meso-butanediol dehydrogenase / (S,S)-butanediol dehydrogenase / diacetyl reductase
VLLKEKVALVTGAAAGIGAGLAEFFAENGARVVLLDANGAGAEAKAAAVRKKGSEAIAFAADLRDREKLRAAVDETLARFGGIDILINNAGIYPRQSFLER